MGRVQYELFCSSIDLHHESFSEISKPINHSGTSESKVEIAPLTNVSPSKGSSSIWTGIV